MREDRTVSPIYSYATAEQHDIVSSVTRSRFRGALIWTALLMARGPALLLCTAQILNFLKGVRGPEEVAVPP